MKLSKAISQKISKICTEKGITVNKLAAICYLTQSTVQSLADGKSQNPKILTIFRICEGLGIQLKDFFSDDLFDNLERED